MKSIHQIAAAAALAFVAASPVLAQGTTFQNGSFDGNSLSGWQTFGDVRTVNGRVSMTTASTAFDDDNLGAGNEGFLNESGVAAVDMFNEPTLAGIPVTSFDIGGYAYEGSGIRQSFSALAGSTLNISFDWAFSSTDTANPDFGFIAINDSVHKFVDTGSQYLTGKFLGSFVDAQNVTWNWFNSTYSYEAAADGSLSLALGVVDINDYSYTSRLRIDNVTVSAVPEPETYALMLTGLGVLAGAMRRRQRAQKGQAAA
jgi:hypothetical protein